MSLSPARARSALFAALLGVLASPAASQPPQASDWGIAYERGVEALRQGQAGRAALLFERAARGRPEPGRNLSYGREGRIEEYYPYLRMAEALLALGDARAAEMALRRSAQWGIEPEAERQALSEAARRAVDARRGPLPPAPGRGPDGAPARAQTSPGHGEGRAGPPESPAGVDQPPAQARRPPTTAEAPPPFSKAPPLGALLVVTRPPGASVYLDDEYVGSTDPRTGRLMRSGVAPGEHRVRASREGHEDVSRILDVAAGPPTSLEIDLPARTRVSAALAGLLGLALLALALVLRARRSAGAPAHPETAPEPPRVRTRPPARSAASDSGVRAAAKPAPHTPTEVQIIVDPTVPGEDQETLAAPPGLAATGERFGPYRLVQQLGRGGMASVYKAERDGEFVALKRPLPGFLEDPGFVERFSREAEIGRSLHHPNIVRIRERGEVEGVPYFTMELIEGQTLHTRLARSGALDPAEATRVVVQVAEALDYAHLKGIVHRDLKPSNIMQLPDGAVKVMDYGIARSRRFEGLTVTGAFLGTPDYVAPETADGRGTDARSDLYSLGIVFYELVTGRRPFYGSTPFETLRKHCSEPPRPPSTLGRACPAEIETAILRLLAKDPVERYASAEDLLVELRAWLNRPAA